MALDDTVMAIKKSSWPLPILRSLLTAHPNLGIQSRAVLFGRQEDAPRIKSYRFEHAVMTRTFGITLFVVSHGLEPYPATLSSNGRSTNVRDEADLRRVVADRFQQDRPLLAAVKAQEEEPPQGNPPV